MKILFFVDSVTQGFHDELAGGWCNRLVTYVMEKDIKNENYDKSAFNLGPLRRHIKGSS